MGDHSIPKGQPRRRQRRDDKEDTMGNSESTEKRRAKQRAWGKYSKLKKENEFSKSDLADHIRELKQKYVEKRNQSNKANREAAKDYENKLAANVKRDSKSFYKYVRSRTRKKDRVGPITDNH